jgi:hypothetical protein
MTKTVDSVKMKSGYVYSFKYQAWENDPKPTVIFMYAFTGNHPTTGRQWRFFQAINFTYIPRADRKRFAQDWMTHMANTNNVKFTWNMVKASYPYMEHAVRRYMYTPKPRITNMREIPWDKLDKAIVSTFSKDFSKKVYSSLINKFRAVMANRRQFKKTGKFPKI